MKPLDPPAVALDGFFALRRTRLRRSWGRGLSVPLGHRCINATCASAKSRSPPPLPREVAVSGPPPDCVARFLPFTTGGLGSGAVLTGEYSVIDPEPAASGRGRVKTAHPAEFRQPDVEIRAEGWPKREFRAFSGCARSSAVSQVLGRAGRIDSKAKRVLHPQQAFRACNIWPMPRICITRLRL